MCILENWMCDGEADCSTSNDFGIADDEANCGNNTNVQKINQTVPAEGGPSNIHSQMVPAEAKEEPSNIDNQTVPAEEEESSNIDIVLAVNKTVGGVFYKALTQNFHFDKSTNFSLVININ